MESDAPRRGRNFAVEVAIAPPLPTQRNRTRHMNAVPSQLLQQAEQLSADVTRPIPGSHKIHVEGSRPDIRVPMREIALARTPTMFGGEDNAPLAVYDTSGAYTDANAVIDLAQGLAPLRAQWIAERGDTEALASLSSEFGRKRE